MVVGVALVFLIQWLFLGDLRSALIVSATIPFALLFAVVILVLNGESANLLSMGAIDFGIIVDATGDHGGEHFPPSAEASTGTYAARRLSPWRGFNSKQATIFQASSEVTLDFLRPPSSSPASCRCSPCRASRAIFGPMAKTYAYALLGGLFATFTVSPALAAVLLPEKVRERDDRAACAGFIAGGRSGAGPARALTLVTGLALVVCAGPRRQHGRPGVPAQARGRQHLDARGAATVGVAR